MKRTATLSLILALSSSSFALAQSVDMKSMGMKDMDRQQCHEMIKDKKGSETKGTDMRGMSMQQCHDMMHGNDQEKGRIAKDTTHTTTAVVKAVEPENSKVTLAHGPVKSLKWPAMTMGFTVKDKALFDKLVVNKKIDISFTKKGSDYVVTSVK